VSRCGKTKTTDPPIVALGQHSAEHPHRPLLIFLGVTGFDGKGVDEAEDYKPITGKAKIVSLGHSAMRAAA